MAVMGSMKRWAAESSVAVVAGMLTVQVLATGLQLLSRLILNEGTFVFALMTYRHVVAALCVSPLAFFSERGKLKKLSWFAGFWFFINALTGILMAMGFFYYGLGDTSAAYATNFLTLIPVLTFLFSTILRMEKLRLGTRAGKVKTMGAILCLAGALIISLYKGKSLYITHHHMDHHSGIIPKVKPNKTRGTLFLVCSCLSFGTWFIVQVKTFEAFPYKFWATTVTFVIASVQSAVAGSCLNQSKSSWTLGWNLQLITIFYSGVVSAATFCLISWAVTRRGPTYPSMFNPLALIFVTIAEALFLGEAITVGSLVGMLLIIVGLYSFLWGKNKEVKAMANLPIKAAVAEASTVDASAPLPSASPNNDTRNQV
ncbi:WAT1-related protein At5g64700-like [Diospyros lotus]|uniref:WAT1-related protein At5g64700-like n=1 Tax=Diospyros lotus TaxID=55363 RepID=UPI00225A9D15|nr:WAT1-related protein At5g64700-like [Diospyros lotus]